MRFSIDIHGPERMKSNDLGDFPSNATMRLARTVVTFHLATCHFVQYVGLSPNTGITKTFPSASVVCALENRLN